MTKIDEYLKQNMVFTPMVVGYLIKNGQVLLGLRKKVSWGLGENLVSGIGGKVGDTPEIANETNEEALVREFWEEIGITPTKFENMGKVRFIFPNKPKWNSVVQIYNINEWKGEPVETEVILPIWYQIDNLPFAQMWDDGQYWTPEVLAGEKVEMIFLYDEAGKKVVEKRELI